MGLLGEKTNAIEAPSYANKAYYKIDACAIGQRSNDIPKPKKTIAASERDFILSGFITYGD